ncbi:MAG TPA: hypothetical protein VD994_08805 [Prosthecobacter sp.]|nr:hypothetical protein [Prosthecobacter sp.]
MWLGLSLTVFLENVYRRIERWIDGDAANRRRLDDADWSLEKLFRRGLKHGLYLLISAAIAHI